MNAPVRYLEATSTPVDLGGGLVAYIRPIPAELWLLKLGHVPPAFSNTIAAQNSQTRKAEAEAFVRDNPDWAVTFATVLVTASVVAMKVPDEKGELVTVPLTVVDAPQAECKPGEMSVGFFPAEHLEKINTAALELNGLTTEAAEKHRPFFRGALVAVWLAARGALLPHEPAHGSEPVGAGAGEAQSDHGRAAAEATH
jgi:hypothetical protein